MVFCTYDLHVRNSGFRHSGLNRTISFLQMREMLPDTCEGETEGHVVKFNEYVSGPGSAEPLTPAENPYSRLGDLEPANLISFAYQIAAGMVR